MIAYLWCWLWAEEIVNRAVYSGPGNVIVDMLALDRAARTFPLDPEVRRAPVDAAMRLTNMPWQILQRELEQALAGDPFAPDLLLHNRSMMAAHPPAGRSTPGSSP